MEAKIFSDNLTQNLKEEASKENNKSLFWLTLWTTLRSDYRQLQKIAQSFSDLRQVFIAREEKLLSLGLDKEKINQLISGRALEEGKKLLNQLAQKNYWIISIEEREYPPLLREINFPPYLLFGVGRKDVLTKPAVAIVGSRRPSSYGRSMAEKLSAELAARGLVIVSGLARGIDSLAHEAALTEGETIAVLGSGLEKIYPPENWSLFKRIAAVGAVISEYLPHEPPLAHHFPWRNRLISGLSLATVVVEASSQSGSLITARLALDQNREVMAVPGKAGSELSQGTNALIKAGAKLVENWLDVVVELPSDLRDAILLKEKEANNKKREIESMDNDEKAVMSYLSSEEKISLEELVLHSGKQPAELLSILFRLEMKGLILTYPGPSYQRRG
ncbi:MAG: DNA-processing protein DprA [Candidatus Aminicenantes bacterium]|nr:DNA-processing protein DprA [Candidatus Aminicenantes bacterium]